MADAVKRHRPVGILIEEGVGKSSDQDPSIVFVNFRVKFGHATDALDASVDTAQKLLSQAESTFFIPVIGIADILRGFRRKNEFSGHIDF